MPTPNYSLPTIEDTDVANGVSAVNALANATDAALKTVADASGSGSGGGVTSALPPLVISADGKQVHCNFSYPLYVNTMSPGNPLALRYDTSELNVTSTGHLELKLSDGLARTSRGVLVNAQQGIGYTNAGALTLNLKPGSPLTQDAAGLDLALGDGLTVVNGKLTAEGSASSGTWGHASGLFVISNGVDVFSNCSWAIDYNSALSVAYMTLAGNVNSLTGATLPVYTMDNNFPAAALPASGVRRFCLTVVGGTSSTSMNVTLTNTGRLEFDAVGRGTTPISGKLSETIMYKI